MQPVYMVLHFLLAMVWIGSAVMLDLRFRKNFAGASVEERLTLMRGIRSFSGKTEMPITLLLLVLGGILLMVNTAWFKVGAMHGKLTLALVAIGLLHASRGVMKKMITALEQGDNAEALAKKYGRMRAVVLLLLVLITAMILGVKASLSMPNSFQLIGA
jgi:uncharacterized membrane protein